MGSFEKLWRRSRAEGNNPAISKSQEGAPKTLLSILIEAESQTEKPKIYEALTPELVDLIRKLDHRAYLRGKIAVLKELCEDFQWETLEDIDVDVVNNRLSSDIDSGKIRSTQEESADVLKGGSPFRDN